MESEQNSSTLRHYLNLYVRISGGQWTIPVGQPDPNRTLSGVVHTLVFEPSQRRTQIDRARPIPR
jgi:hypothetical protein